MEQKKTFLVSTADFSYFVNGILACTGTTNLNTSLEVSVQEQNVNGGKGNKLLYSYKYGRELSATIETANWKLEYIAANVGSNIVEGLTDVYKMGECVTLTNGIGILEKEPIGDVAVELSEGTILTVTPNDNKIDLTGKGLTNESVKVTYRYNTIAKTLKINADSTPYVGKLILDADKHNNDLGKVGSVQITIPSYQLSGNFTINFTPDGVVSTNLDGKALAVDSDKCEDGSSVYAYIKEFDDIEKALTISDLAVTPGKVSLNVNDTTNLTVVGIKGAFYSPIKIDNADCTFVSDDSAKATVTNDGLITAIAAGDVTITVTYNNYSDTVNVTVV